MNRKVITPNILYNYVKIGNQVFSGMPDKSVKASFSADHNSVVVSMTPKNCSLANYRVLITKAHEEYDLDIGKVAYSNYNIENNKEHIFTITLDEILLPENGSYRISFYAQSAIDYSWDVTYLLYTSQRLEKFVPHNYEEGYEVLTNKQIDE